MKKEEEEDTLVFSSYLFPIPFSGGDNGQHNGAGPVNYTPSFFVYCLLCLVYTSHSLKASPPLKLLMLLVFTSVFQEVLILLVLLASFPHVPHLTPLDKAGYLVPFFFFLSLSLSLSCFCCSSSEKATVTGLASRCKWYRLEKIFRKSDRGKETKRNIFRREPLRYVNDFSGAAGRMGLLPLSQHQHKDTGTPYVNLSHYCFVSFFFLLFFFRYTFLQVAAAGERNA